MARDLQHWLSLPDTGQQVHVVLFRTETEYHRYMATYFPAFPMRRAIYVRDRGPGMLFTHWHPELKTDLRHEVTHAILNDDAPPLPLWLDEGLAEYFEQPPEARFRGNPYAVQTAARAAQGYVPSLDRLEQLSELSQFGEAEYRDSWSWVHFCLHRREETRELLVRFVRARRAGAPALELSRQLRQVLSDVEHEFAEHFASLALAPPAP